MQIKTEAAIIQLCKPTSVCTSLESASLGPPGDLALDGGRARGPSHPGPQPRPPQKDRLPQPTAWHTRAHMMREGSLGSGHEWTGGRGRGMGVRGMSRRFAPGRCPGGAVLSAPNRRRGRFGCPRVGVTCTGFDSVAFVPLRNDYINFLIDLVPLSLTPHRSWVPQPGFEGTGRGAPRRVAERRHPKKRPRRSKPTPGL